MTFTTLKRKQLNHKALRRMNIHLIVQPSSHPRNIGSTWFFSSLSVGWLEIRFERRHRTVAEPSFFLYKPRSAIQGLDFSSKQPRDSQPTAPIALLRLSQQNPNEAMKGLFLTFTVFAFVCALSQATTVGQSVKAAESIDRMPTSIRANWRARCGSRYSSCTWAVKCREGKYPGCYADNKAVTDACCSCYSACKKSRRNIYKERCRTRARKYGRTC